MLGDMGAKTQSWNCGSFRGGLSDDQASTKVLNLESNTVTCDLSSPYKPLPCPCPGSCTLRYRDSLRSSFSIDLLIIPRASPGFCRILLRYRQLWSELTPSAFYLLDLLLPCQAGHGARSPSTNHSTWAHRHSRASCSSTWVQTFLGEKLGRQGQGQPWKPRLTFDDLGS